MQLLSASRLVRGGISSLEGYIAIAIADHVHESVCVGQGPAGIDYSSHDRLINGSNMCIQYM